MQRFRVYFAAVFVLLALATAPSKAESQVPDREFTLINVKYQGKVIWLPSALIVKKGDKIKLTLINNVPDDPDVHGFSIPQFGVKEEVKRGTPLVVEFMATEAGLFDTNCHMHPAHLKGQLLVLE